MTATFAVQLHFNCKLQVENTDGKQRQFAMRNTRRSGCPINLTLEMLGDRWSLIVIRDVMFGNRRHFGDLMRLSDEGIASNILASRLTRMVSAGLLSRADDPTHKQKAIYSLTERSIQLVPLLAWGRRHTPASKELSIRAQLLEDASWWGWTPETGARADHRLPMAPSASKRTF